ncbi:MAG: ribosome biogenesis GTPase YlqF [Defluviitaleaceae bacterium]|nr:ribosome biogenesis GTPase YlqF [Defluviitaleaceae bacterium]MCL2836219.1 ribosome biogenesis GTPase YlqF [Defluviitaleaceae bacterium]
MNIHWYPGHMTKSKRIIMADVSLCDVVVELLDARIPLSSRNPDIREITAGKKHIIVLNKADLAEEGVTAKWVNFYASQGTHAIAAKSNSSKHQTAVIQAAEALMRKKHEKQKSKGRVGVTTRAIVLGIPNVGKSTLINQYARRQAAAAADRPGVTRGRQWVRISPVFELLDTPGILWPKVDDPDVSALLALTGAVKETIPDMTELALYGLKLLRDITPAAVKTRYKVDFTEDESDFALLEKIGAARGFRLTGGAVDLERAAVTLVHEFRDGKLGRVSLERPEIMEQ